MYIKYKDNIHNISKYYSVMKPKEDSNYLHLIKDGDDHIVLEFEDSNMASYFRSKIWEKLESENKFYDIDKDIKVYKEAAKYNL